MSIGFKLLGLGVLGLGASLLVACSNTPSPPSQPQEAYITGSAFFRERMALPDNAIFEALLEDVSRADAPAVVLGQQNIGPAGHPPYAVNIAYSPAKLRAGSRYNVRTSIRVNDKLWFISDQAVPVLQHASDTKVNILMRRVSAVEQPPAPRPTPKPGSQAPADTASKLVPKALLHTWQVSRIGNTNIAAGSTSPTLRFEATEARISGNTSCNNFSANYTSDGQQLQFKDLMMTKMLCMGSHEKAFVDALSSVRSQHLAGDNLHLRNASGVTVITAKRQ